MLATGVILLLFLLFGIGAIVGNLSESFDGFYISRPKPLKMESNSILHLKLDKPVSDRSYVELNQTTFQLNSTAGLDNILTGIRYAKTDDRVEGIYLDLDIVSAGMATLEEIREALVDFKSTGKFIIAYSNAYSQKAYYMATVADEVYLNPEGYFQFSGLTANVTFVKGLFEKLDIDMQIIRGSNNKFKSAVEPLMNDSMSVSNELQNRKLISGVWSKMLLDINESREKLTKDRLNSMADSLPIMNPEQAKATGMIDDVLFHDQFHDLLMKKGGIAEDLDEHLVGLNNYGDRLNSIDRYYLKDKGNIAVVYAYGSIGVNDGNSSDIGLNNIPDAIKAAREDDEIKAVVLRVNSPGGAVLTSDVIWREVSLTQKEKPVVVSMGDVAASGGYYISCPTEYIFASPTTITGSIGVFAVWPNMKGFFNEKLGITFDQVKTNQHADFGSISRPLRLKEKNILQNEIDQTYADFKQKVVDGRSTFDSQEQVDEIGQGRVWNGMDALEIGLVDEHGGLSKAIRYAAKIAEVDQIYVEEFPKVKLSGFEKVLQALNNMEDDDKQASFTTPNAAKVYTEAEKFLFDQYMEARELMKMKGVQARMPYKIEIK